MTEETPFRPREQLIAKQKHYQSLPRYTHLRYPRDQITSKYIPLALAGSSIFLIIRGIYRMANGTHKIE